ncbi:MAG: glycosyltransferase [Flavobacteriaceae bacterium]|nr:glycosyltransferase [Flavobacteriaceae bacterium]
MLAIVIPYYNLTFFEATLQSLANQTNQQFKVYIGDDASPENPSGLLEKYQAKFDFHYHRFETNLGGTSLVKQWERCIAITGNEEWIMILGDDDVLENNCVAAFYENLKEIEALKLNVIRYATTKINEVDKTVSAPYFNPKIEKSIDFLFRKLNGGTRSSLSEFVFRKETMQHIRFKDFPLAWHSDVLAILEFSNFCSIYSINESFVFVRSSGINISSRLDNLILKNLATFKYYYYLISNKLTYFDFYQKIILYDALEKSFLDNKKNGNYWIKLTRLYFVNYEFRRYFVFLKKVYKSVLKRRY